MKRVLERKQLLELKELQLYRVATDPLGGVVELEATLQVLVVVTGNFDDKIGYQLSAFSLESVKAGVT